MLTQHGEQWPARHDLTSPESLGAVGEPTKPKAWLWYYRHGGSERCFIVGTS
ncbi:MAG: hypothetical protein Q8P22_07435 [Chloroflexota bacterium]|nr:hypothetical protein [Chloroflexota bacterium]